MLEPKAFSNKLLHWHSSTDRDMPWKLTQDPYKIWVSEIILQQTRVEQGKPYYLRFIERFPDVGNLANAKEDDVLKQWQGLGYYSRARNMHAAAKEIQTKYNGVFPNNYDDILSLKGVGPYTAAAISSFAFNQSYPVIDGNVKRVISRFLGLMVDVDKGEGKKRMTDYLKDAILYNKPAPFNQAIMDFGALQCTPVKPECMKCIFKKNCFAFMNSKVESLPIKKRPIRKKSRILHYLIIESNGKIHIQKRSGKDIWEGLYEPFKIKSPQKKALTKAELEKEISNQFTMISVSNAYKHILSHQELKIFFYHVEMKDNSENLSSFNLVYKGNLRNFAFPKIIDRYLEEKKIYL